MTKPIRKRFDPLLHKATDAPAKEAGIKVLSLYGFTAVENKDKHKVDLLVYNNKNEHIFNCEVELKTSFKAGQEFKYSDVNFLSRKIKYCTLDKPTIFLLFNTDYTNYIAIRDKDVLSSPEEVVKNKYCFEGEIFKKVPLTKAKFGSLKGLLPEYEI